MKRRILTVLVCLVVIVFWAGSISAVVDDPTGTFQKIQQLNDAHSLQIATIVDNITLDYHPTFGIVKASDYPVNAKGSSTEEIQAMFVADVEAKGYVINQMTVTENTLSGRVLVEHLISNQRAYVWHQLNNAPVTTIDATATLGGKCYRLVRVWIQTCTNGAGYWDWQYIEVPCDYYIYTVDYYSNTGLLTPYPMHEWPAPPPIDPTGNFQKIHDLNVAHRAQVDAILNTLNVDNHPVYGCVGAADYPVNPNGMTVADANAMMIEQTVGMELIDSSVEQVTLSGKVLSEHMIEGNLTWVWHEYNNTPIFYGTALLQTTIPDAGTSELSRTTDIYHGQPRVCYERRWVWTPPCSNGAAGYWSWKYVRVPCPTDLVSNLAVDYSREMGVLVNSF